MLKRVALRALRHGSDHLDDNVLHGIGIGRADVESLLVAHTPIYSRRTCGSAVCRIEAAPLG